MAYFPGEVGQRPQDVAVVLTSRGQTALWVNANTTGLFTTTGVTFTALLGPRVGDGEFAGVGDNGYANFSCYQRYRKDLYQYGPATCSQVYLCDHSDPPGKFALVAPYVLSLHCPYVDACADTVSLQRAGCGILTQQSPITAACPKVRSSALLSGSSAGCFS